MQTRGGATLLMDQSHASVYVFARVLADSNANEGVEPRYSWTNHTLPVTDVHVGCGGCRARVVTASRDKSVKVRLIF